MRADMLPPPPPSTDPNVLAHVTDQPGRTASSLHSLPSSATSSPHHAGVRSCRALTRSQTSPSAASHRQRPPTLPEGAASTASWQPAPLCAGDICMPCSAGEAEYTLTAWRSSTFSGILVGGGRGVGERKEGEDGRRREKEGEGGWWYARCQRQKSVTSEMKCNCIRRW